MNEVKEFINIMDRAVELHKEVKNKLEEKNELTEQIFNERKNFTVLNQELLNVYRENYLFLLQLILDTPEENLDRLKFVAKYLLERRNK